MAKPKYITVDNYREFKPSEFVHSFISDLESVSDCRAPMDMGNFDLVKGKNGGIKCLPCLGGLALMNMGLDYHNSANGDWILANLIGDLGDCIYIWNTFSMRYMLSHLYPELNKEIYNIHIPDVFAYKRISGLISPKKALKELTPRIMALVEALEKEGI